MPVRRFIVMFQREEADGSTVVSLSHLDALKLEEANVTIDDDFRLRETINDDEAEQAHFG